MKQDLPREIYADIAKLLPCDDMRALRSCSKFFRSVPCIDFSENTKRTYVETIKRIKQFIQLSQKFAEQTGGLFEQETAYLSKLQNDTAFGAEDVVNIYKFNQIYQFFDPENLLLTLIVHAIKKQTPMELLSGLLDIGSTTWHVKYWPSENTPHYFFADNFLRSTVLMLTQMQPSVSEAQLLVRLMEEKKPNLKTYKFDSVIKSCAPSFAAMIVKTDRYLVATGLDTSDACVMRRIAELDRLHGMDEFGLPPFNGDFIVHEEKHEDHVAFALLGHNGCACRM
jgi:hypothetical protein